MQLEKVYIDSLVVGGGIVGLSIANEISKFKKSILIEKNKYLLSETSSRNSGVIHSGIYYPKNSLKDYHCRNGNELLYKYCKDNNINHKKTGKFIICNNDQKKRFYDLLKLGTKKNLAIREFSIQELQKIYPSLQSDLCMFIEDSGILDVHELACRLEFSIQENNSLISLETELIDIKKKQGSFYCHVKQGGQCFLIVANELILSCGLYTNKVLTKCSDQAIASIASDDNFYVGHYYKTKNFNDFEHLVYPIPEENSLGIHICIGFEKSFMTFGPDAEKTNSLNYKDFVFNNSLKEKFFSAIESYIPSIREYDLNPDYVGIRPKTKNNNDFEILEYKHHGIENLCVLRSIESPGLTSALSLGKTIAKLSS